jgi:hypothetical protein
VSHPLEPGITQSPTAAEQGDAVLSEPTVRIAAFGDSLMWGQGLERAERFSELIALGLGKHLAKRPHIIHDHSRSGAKIHATARERSEFLDTYPTFIGHGLAPFSTPLLEEIGAFLSGTDESAADQLYGELPSSLPTILGQLQMLSDGDGAAVDVVLLDGGLNDVSLEDIVDPRVETGRWIEHFDGMVRGVAHDDVLDLVTRVRLKCPKAVILYFGFFPIFSYESNTAEMRDILQHEFNNDFRWWLNEHVAELFGEHVDVNRIILEGIVRALWLRGRWQYWTRKAVDDANQQDNVRGPGILFVPSGFTEQNSALAPDPFLWDDPIDPSADDARDERARRIPRGNQLDEMRVLVLEIVGGSGPPGHPQQKLNQFVLGKAKELHDAVDGPSSLREALANVAAGQDVVSGRDMRAAAVRGLRSEVGRIQHALIASSFHPNTKGAACYAQSALTRWKEHESISDAIVKAALGGGVTSFGRENLDQALRRLKLRSIGALEGDVGHLNVDSLAVRVMTASDSDSDIPYDVVLVVSIKNPGGEASSRQFLLNFKYDFVFKAVDPDDSAGPHSQTIRKTVRKFYPHFEPGKTNFFTIDTEGGIRLDEIVGCSLVLGEQPEGFVGVPDKLWRPENVRLEVNGREVINLTIRGRELGAGERLDLHWPAPEPGFTAPKLKRVELAMAPPLDLQARAFDGGGGTGTIG